MKNQFVNLLKKIGFLSVIALITGVGSTQAQSLAYKMRANIPFDFIVAGKKMPAGEYSIGRAQQDAGDDVLLITSLRGRASAVRSTTPIETSVPKYDAVLVFHRYQDQYFLFQVWPAGSTTGRVLSESRIERELERSLAVNSAAGKMTGKAGAVETVTIAGGIQ